MRGMGSCGTTPTYKEQIQFEVTLNVSQLRNVRRDTCVTDMSHSYTKCLNLTWRTQCILCSFGQVAQFVTLHARRRYSNRSGVDVRPRDFGGLGGVAAIDPALRDQTPYFQPLIEALQQHGYAVRLLNANPVFQARSVPSCAGMCHHDGAA